MIFLSNWNEDTNIWTEYFLTKYPHIMSKDINALYRLDNHLYIATNFGLLI